MQATPTMWHTLIDAGWHGNGRLRIFVGGEALSPNLARELLQRGEVWNLYGPTEATVWSTCKRIDHPDRITIGRPIDNTEVHVLDNDGAVLPSGVTGELCIGGAGLARGYLGRPDLTAERFIQNPAGPPGERIYRTGDLAQLLDDGELRYLGRADDQVKIRGFRVELGEVEHALGELDCVNRAVVVKWESAGAAATLVAFVVPSQGADYEPREISRLLRQRLPAYMIPSRFIWISSLPRTPNGKIDRAALPDPFEVLDDPDRYPRLTQPRTETEVCLYRIWSEVLSRNNIALDDDFFDLGGQSILAVRICDRIHQTLMVDLPVSALLDYRSIVELSVYIDGLRKRSVAQPWTSVVPIQPNGTSPAIFCVSGVGGNPLTFLDLADALGPQQPLYALEYQGVDGKHRPHDSIEAMAEMFLRDIRALQSTGPYILAGYSGGGLAAYEAAVQLIAAGEEVPLLILLDTIRPRLAGWSRGQRVRQHRAQVRAVGIGYVVRRVVARSVIAVGGVTTRVRAGLAAFWPYRFRLAAVEMAGHRAAEAYAPELYQGDVLLFQSDPEIGSKGGIPVRQHESNGWRDLVDGDLEVVAVGAGHLNIVEGDAAVVVASTIGRALSSKMKIDCRRRA
jgi:thioesterase domain-containing protein/acyl carrier protein